MGILDEAIREHLELKRQHGARESEIKQMEDEAFGPPSRPGDPEFGDSEEAAERPEAEGGDGADATAVIGSAGSRPEDAGPVEGVEETRASAGAPPRADAPAEAIGEAEDQPPPEPAPEETEAQAPPEPPEATEEPASPALAPEPPPEAWREPTAREHPLPGVTEEARGGEALEEETEAEAGSEAAEEISDAERARREHPDLGDTMQHDALGETDQGVASEPAPPREGPLGEEPRAAEEPEAAGEPEAEEPATGVEPGTEESAADRPHLRAVEPAAEEEPSEGTDGGEPAGGMLYDYAEEEGEEEIDVRDLDLDLDDAFEDLGEEPVEDEDARSEGGEPPAPGHGAPEEGGEPAAGEEDLLEETPEFLRDAPDSDALWFEQGEPRDFDFDDD